MTLLLITVARIEKSVSRYDQALVYADKALLHAWPGHKQLLHKFYFHKGLCLYESGRLLAKDGSQERFSEADTCFEKAALAIKQMFSLLDNSSLAVRQAAISYYLQDKQTLYEQAFTLNYRWRGDMVRTLYWAHLQKMQAVLVEMAQSLPPVRTAINSPGGSGGNALPNKTDNLSYVEFRTMLLEKEHLIKCQKIVVLEYYCIQDNIYVFTIRSDWDSPTVERIPLKVSEVHERQIIFMAGTRLIRDIPLTGRMQWWQAMKPLVQTVDLWSQPGNLIYFMPHGVTQNLPLHTLQSGEGKMVIERNPVMWAPSAAILYQTWLNGKREQNGPPGFLVMGDAMDNLPGAKQEAIELASLFGRQPITGSQATKELFLRELAYTSLLHFCGHGYFIKERGLESYIELAHGEKLTSADVMEVTVEPGAMVVLSGCETGLNQGLAGDELMGLSRGFLLAGVDSLMVSLWEVDDESTLFFFKLYYEHFLVHKENKAVALWKTMNQMKEQGYSFLEWGAFIINGNF